MDTTRKMLFSLQKFQIVALYTSATAEQRVSDSYVYAWSAGVYPLLNESAPWHPPFEEGFAVRSEELGELYQFLRGRWEQKEPLSFYGLEDRYGIKGPRRPGPVWNQENLAHACRYFFLHGEFDAAFWSALLEYSQHPAIAEGVAAKFDPDSVRFE